MTHRIRLEGAQGFSAGHFATFEGALEPLHGHNYAVTVELVGSLSEDSWVLDFRRAKKVVAGICREVDHRFLLQRDSRELEIEETPGSWTISFGNRRYVMPVGDVVALPIDNTTAERLAEWFAGQIAEALSSEGVKHLESVTVGVEEAPGQSGWYTLALR